MSKVVSAGGTAIGVLLQQSFEDMPMAFKNSFIGTLPYGVWPFYGGNAASHGINMFGEDDITWYGTVTHNSNGITGNGTDATGHLHINLAARADPTKWSMAVYNRTNTASDAMHEIGVSITGNYN